MKGDELIVALKVFGWCGNMRKSLNHLSLFPTLFRQTASFEGKDVGCSMGVLSGRTFDG